ncbi:hypothetical protein ACH4MA_22495 [Streptomyces roseolus]|uniref:hypothetical protein n=1 Tax=Streptomyces roseolus TaxID=67358 RepID=UPI0037B84949
MKNRRRLTRITATMTLVVAAFLGGTATPAAAHDNRQAIYEGCGWSSGYTELDRETIYNPAGALMGSVFLLWNGSKGQNCVVTHQFYSAGHGIPVKMVATLGIRSSGSGAITYRTDTGNYGHFAAVKEYTTGQCVNFRGEIAGSVAGRNEWGNCG